MSKIGKILITVPINASVSITDRLVQVKGPKGELATVIPDNIVVEQQNGTLAVKRLNEIKATKALHGLIRSLLNNNIKGVTDGFTRTLEINGVGFKAELRGNQVVLSVGFSHPVVLDIIEGVEIKQDKNQLIVSGIDKQRVGHMAALIRSIKKPEPYKGKGIKYSDETIRRKAGKAAKTA
ncbi:50S ribosomal protein L6 [candidate division Kazan bacterium RIFCSPHIGHO2_01_FULL_44_14]|uniref:Large ribosomal subunit protein uL6 n=1 Tax=candidate division Kazan bacterium RIFCSPLOWO2_01_FULL_45_19 TaxID=1798538 RepID=A0A1F4NPR3_UNCK3|nr:hypothetical protein [uncultured bacterium]OGB73400.1 MAG: 50S ribosomal protein L6 [candidate division Kazan bacterium RIFCSPLOWO2_01_FULL_45_19]OGB77645.1 MAG: 50S ribosomal protein L6 [candidate division Kazan bacterium RIFCSPHIGHO2_01_FULL_44_14]